MTRYGIKHRTTYQYLYPVSISHHSAHLKPLSDPNQTCESFSLRIDPSSVDLIERSDFFENAMHMFSIQETHEKLVVESNSQVLVNLEAAKLEDFTTTHAEVIAAHKDFSHQAHIDTKPFLFHTEVTPDLPEVEAFGLRFFKSAKPIGESLLEMLNAFATEFEFDPDATEVSTPVAQVIKEKRGVCQDFTHLMISALRSCGVAARYVSGYILTEPPPGQERLQGADASHAWLSVFDPANGWVDLDPTNNLICSEQDVRVAYGRDYSDVVMLGGAVTGGGQQNVTVEVTMHPIEASTPQRETGNALSDESVALVFKEAGRRTGSASHVIPCSPTDCGRRQRGTAGAELNHS